MICYNKNNYTLGELKMATLTKQRSRGRHAMDMTQGSIAKNIIVFAFPLLLGNLFQQLYNLVDTWVIGQTGNNAAFAAVGNVGQIINILIGFFLGFSSGAGVIVSQYFGAQDEKNAKETAHTAIALTLVLSVVFTVVGILITPTALKLMLHTDAEGADNQIFIEARTYLYIYFAGVISLMIYNMGSGLLRAIGDSRHPFYFLIAAAVTNIVLDLLFVFKFNMGTAGVALATVIAQTLSAVLTVIALLKSDSYIKINIKELKFTKVHLIKILKVGLPAAIQMALTSFSNVFVQSYISAANIPGGVAVDQKMQEVAMSSWTTYSKIDQFIFLPIQSIGLAVTTFVGQNLGVGDTSRAKKGTYIALAMAFASAIILIIPIIIFAPLWASIFNAIPDVVKNSALLLRYFSPFYVCCCVNQVLSAALRGSGNTKAPMIIMLCTFVGFRQIALYIISNYISNDLIPIGFSYPLGWIACATTLLIYFGRFDMSKTRLVESK